MPIILGPNDNHLWEIHSVLLWTVVCSEGLLIALIFRVTGARVNAEFATNQCVDV